MLNDRIKSLMQDPYNALYEQFTESLDNAEADDADSVAIARIRTGICIKALGELRQHVIDNPFKDAEAEIYFFKYIKPQFYSHFIYNLKIHKIETLRPDGGPEFEEQYLRDRLRDINLFYCNNRDFYQYYREGSTHQDAMFFIRRAPHVNGPLHSFTLDADPTFCTVLDYVVSKMLANERLKTYLLMLIKALTVAETTETVAPDIEGDLIWTGGEARLVEISKGFQETGVFNHGQANMTQIVRKLERVFKTKVGNINNILQDFGRRKKGVAKFAEDIRNSIIRYYEAKD